MYARALVSARIDHWIERQRTGRTSLSRRRTGIDGNRGRTTAGYSDSGCVLGARIGFRRRG